MDLGVAALTSVAASNPLTFSSLIKTLLFQVGIIGSGTLWFSRVGSPILEEIETKAMQSLNRLRKLLGLMFVFAWKGAFFIVLTATLGVLLTDVGWPPAFQTWGLSPMAFLMARAAGAPNGAHLLSYIPLPLVGIYAAWKFRKDVLLDCLQGILLVGFGVAFHELPWMLVYLVRYYVQLGLFVGANFTEDLGFAIMCFLLILAWWKYPRRSIPLSGFKWPFVAYSAFMGVWFLYGVPVTTINNFQIGKGPFEITQWWADPIVNGVEILSWIFVAAMFFLVVRRAK